MLRPPLRLAVTSPGQRYVACVDGIPETGWARLSYYIDVRLAQLRWSLEDLAAAGNRRMELAEADHFHLAGADAEVEQDVISGAGAALKERGIESLGAYLLQKPFTSPELLEQIARTLSLSVRLS